MNALPRSIKLSLIAIALASLPCNPAFADNNAKARPNLRHAQPLHGFNVLLNGTETGDDDTTIAPDLSALCQAFLGQPNPYANPAPNVDQIVGDAVIRPARSRDARRRRTRPRSRSTPTTQTTSSPERTTTACSTPREPQRRLGRGLHELRRWRDLDQPDLPILTFQTGATGALYDMDGAGDPALAFGPHNTVYYANLVFSRLNERQRRRPCPSPTTVASTWSEPTSCAMAWTGTVTHADATISNDKEWIADPRQRHGLRDLDAILGPGQPDRGAKSTDGGAHLVGRRHASHPAPKLHTAGLRPTARARSRRSARRRALHRLRGAVCDTLDCDRQRSRRHGRRDVTDGG